MTRYGVATSLALGAIMLVASTGCSKNLTTSAQDRTLVAGPIKQAAIDTTTPKEEVRVTEQPAPPPAPAKNTEQAQTMEQAPAAPPALASMLGELSDVYFDFDKYSLRMDASPTLDTDARLLKAENGWKLIISGHGDERGTSAYNLVLGERRAQTVKKYLEDLGIPTSQLQIVSYGKEKPFCKEHSEDCWQKNRRAHFAVQ
jgi:peptidoglycan-associated lipoprotein